jgi:hypothetical protein
MSLRHATVRCACCGADSSQVVLDSTSQLQPPDLDTRPGEPMRATLPAWTQACASCGYAARRIDEGLAHDVAPIVRAADYRAAREDARIPQGARAFTCAALLLERLGHFADAGWSSLHAAWACDDADDDDAARTCRDRAVALWQRGKEHGQDFLDDEQQEFLLVTDVLRRTGAFDEARDAAMSGLHLDGLAPLIDGLLRYELALVERRDAGAHAMGELR